jgi:hypothetical protein
VKETHTLIEPQMVTDTATITTARTLTGTVTAPGRSKNALRMILEAAARQGAAGCARAPAWNV